MSAQRALVRSQPPAGMLPNPGRCPEQARDKRVRVQLANGEMGKNDGGATVKPGWAADGSGGCRWTITGSPFDIAFYEVVR